MGGCNDSAKVKELFYSGSLIINENEDYKEGELEDTRIDTNGEIILEDSSLQGKYTSPVLTTEKFNELVASWNIYTLDDSEIELFVKVRVDDKWSRWFSYGKWSQRGQRGSVRNQIDEIAKMNIDTLDLVEDNSGNAIMYSIELRRKNLNIPSPRVRNIFVALRLQEEAQKVFVTDMDYLIELDVPERSQMIVPQIGKVICSPTSLSMVLEYYGQEINTEEVAENVLDKEVNIYGNWSYNVAYGGTKCKYSYVARFASIEDIKDKISKGIPVIASIRTQTEEDLEGAPQAYPYGHLIVIRGFTIKDGEEYVIVNDPAAPEVETVRREYKLKEFDRAWNRMVYILTNQR